MKKCILCEKDATHTIQPDGGRKTYWCNRHFRKRVAELEDRKIQATKTQKLIPVKGDLELLRDEIKDKLYSKWIVSEITDDGDISFSLTQLNVGLEGYYVTLSKEEIQYHLENDER